MPGTSPTPRSRALLRRGRIVTLESLREHLQWAIELEHFTLPPYLCALYSLDPARNPEATEVACSVFYHAIEDGLRELCADLGDSLTRPGPSLGGKRGLLRVKQENADRGVRSC